MPQTEKDRVLQAIADVAAEKAGTDADMFNEGYANTSCRTRGAVSVSKKTG